MRTGRKRKADAGLVLALACGASPEHAAQKAGLSVRTVYRRLGEAPFREQVQQVRAEMVRRAAGLLTAAGLTSIKTLTELQESASSETVRLGAARAVLELGSKLRDTAELHDRVATLEARLAALLASSPQPDGEKHRLACAGS